MKDSIIFCPKGLCENRWNDVKEFLSKLRSPRKARYQGSVCRLLYRQ